MTSFGCDDAQQIGPDVPHHLRFHHIRINVNGLKGQVGYAPSDHLVCSSFNDESGERLSFDFLLHTFGCPRKSGCVLVHPKHREFIVILSSRRKGSVCDGILTKRSTFQQFNHPRVQGQNRKGGYGNIHPFGILVKGEFEFLIRQTLSKLVAKCLTDPSHQVPHRFIMPHGHVKWDKASGYLVRSLYLGGLLRLNIRA